MSKKHIRFEGFYGYLNYMGYYAGYGGMNWNDMYEVQNSFIDQHSWCDTGYNTVLNGNGEAITLGSGGFQSYDLGQTFNLVKGTFASAWEANQPVTFYTYTYSYGVGFTLKASGMMELGQAATTIQFGNYGGDFKNISKVTFNSGVGEPGNTCSYGAATYGYQLVMDNLVVKWQGTSTPSAHQHVRHAQHALHPATANLGAMFAPAHGHNDGAPASHASSENHTGHDPGGLTFALPQTEHHFGF